MLEVSNEYAKAITADVRDMFYIVSIGGEPLDQRRIPQMRLVEMMGDGKNLSVGVANCAELTLTLRDPGLVDYVGKTVSPYSYITLPDGGVENVPLGKFWVTKANTSNDFKTVKLTCSDRMYYMNGNFSSSLVYPAHVRDVVHEIVERASVEFVEPEFWPDVYVRYKPEGMTFRNAFAFTAGLCGCNVRFNREGKLEFAWYSDSGLSIERETQYLDGLTRTYDKPLSFTVAVTGEKEKYNINIVTEGNGYVTATPSRNVLEGEKVMLTVRPHNSRKLQSIKAVSANGEALALSVVDDGAAYSFIQPDCDVTVTAVFVAVVEYPITCTTYLDGEIITGLTTIRNADTGEMIEVAAEGDVVSVAVAPPEGYAFSHFLSDDIEFTEVSENVFTFTMPAKAVEFSVYIAPADQVGEYAWLHMPVISPVEKPYWAMFYKYSPGEVVNQRFFLVWFDSWRATSRGTSDNQRYYTIEMDGYYQCGSHLTEEHAWDISAWNGNGEAGSALEWSAHVGFQYAGDMGSSGKYCLLASNADLYYNESLIFANNPGAVQLGGKPHVVNGMDVRERNAFTFHKCPDTYSTPAPGLNWMILNCSSYIGMTYDDTLGKYTGAGYVPGGGGICVLFFDGISVKNIGAAFSNKDEQFYTATVLNGHFCLLADESDSSWSTLKEVPEGAVIGLRNPKVDTSYIFGAGGMPCFSGVLAASTNIQADDGMFMYKNSCSICDCVHVAEASTFSLRAAAPADVKPVKLTYTNPLIYEKMVPAVSSSMKDIVFTPAKLKHRGNPALQAGDIVQAPDKDGVYHNILIMQQVMNFGGGMNSDITCYGQDEDATSSSSYSPMKKQIQEEVGASCSDMEHNLAQNQSETLAAIYQSIAGVKKEDSQRFEEVEREIDTINETLTDLKPRVESLEDRVAAIEDDNDLGNLKRELADTDQQIAHCAEIFMLEVMLEGKAPADVVLPYDLDKLHTMRDLLRAQIAELEVTE